MAEQTHTLTLPEVLDIQNVAELHRQCMAAVEAAAEQEGAHAMTLDAGAVQRMTTAGAQVLLSLRGEAAPEGALAVEPASEPFTRALKELGLLQWFAIG